jgi:isochorismate hydrolase
LWRPGRSPGHEAIGCRVPGGRAPRDLHEDLVISGVMTNLCCESTARDAHFRDYRVFIPAGGTGTIAEEMHLASLLNLAFGFAYVTMSDDLIPQIMA